MAGKITTKTFHGGMNKDVDVSLLKDNEYRHAENYKLTVDEASNGYILENAEGNSLWLDISAISGVTDAQYLIGHCFIKPYLVLFFTDTDGDATPTGSGSIIVRVTIDGNKIQESSVIYTEGVNTTYLNFSTTYPIQAVGYYEAPDNIKVYWTDGYNPVRTINIMDSNLATYNAGMLDIVPDFPISASVRPRPELQSPLVSGNMSACSVQYAYQYFLKEGVQTLWSPASSIQTIPENNNQASFGDYKGAEKDDFTAYGVAVEIYIPSENLYTHMRVVAIQYNTYNAVPTIRVLNEYTLNRGTTYTLSFVDSGESIGELAYEEFAVSSNAEYRAKALEIKDNRLFLGNINENFFDVDFDCRAYRHSAAGVARLFETNLSSYIEVDDDDSLFLEYDEVPEDHDCINRFNNLDDEETFVTYQYQADGSTFGAEGENITIGFTTSDYVLDTLGASSTPGDTNNVTIAGTSQYLHKGGLKSYHRNEVYRIGIVFRNDKMQASPVKWVCDVKIPNYGDDSYYHTYVSASNTYARLLGLEVEMANFSSTGASTWEVVYVPRESGDRSILGQGLIQPTISYAAGSYYGPAIHMETETPLGSGVYAPILFISPEVAFNKTLEYRAGDYYQKVGHFAYAAANALDETSNYESKHYKVYDFTPYLGELSSFGKAPLNGGQIIGYDSSENSRYTIDALTVTPYNQDVTDAGISSTMFASEQTGIGILFLDAFTGTDKVPIVNYKRNVFNAQYGGPSYLNRQYNIYISASGAYRSSETNIVWGGDTFIDFFWHQKQSNDPERTVADTTNASTFLFPIESSISPRLSHSDYIYRHLTSARHRMMQEIAGTHEGDIAGTSYILEQELPLYLYNSVYSQLPKAVLHIADSEDFEDIGKFPTRIINSEHKTNNEELDSFTQFLPNNFIDIDGSKGKLNSLMLLKNQLYFWQDTGFGIASVNSRALIQDNQPGLLALGTGGILERYDYISDTVGNQNQFGIVKSRTALYWVDNNKNEFFKYDGKVTSETKIGGVQSWINSTGEIGDVKAVYDHKYNDVIFTVTFNRDFTNVSSDLVDPAITRYFIIDPSTGLVNDVLYNCIVNARYPSEHQYPERNVAISYIGAPTTWLLETDPYGIVNAAFNITIDQDPTLTTTLTFSERVDKFISYNSFTPGKYIETDYGYYSTDDYHDIYQHNDPDAARATYFGVTYDSVITTSFNDKYPYTKAWDALKWVTESVDSDNINQFEDTFQNLEIYNDYQNTGNRTLVVNTTPSVGETEITRRERTWSMSIPRDIVDADVSTNPDIHDVNNHDETQLFKERIRDKYMTIKFTYDNDDGYIFSIPFISSIYRQSVR